MHTVTRTRSWRARVRSRVALAAFALLAALGAGFGACASAPATHAPPEDVRAIRASIDALYAAFCFEPGGQPDWNAQRAAFLPGAIALPPIARGRAARATDIDGFLADFAHAIAAEPIGRTGFHERVLHARIDLFGGIAHAWVAFEGLVPPAGVDAAGGSAAAERMRTRGLDSLQLVRDGQRWLVLSFSTQYASAEQPLPARFAQAGAAD